MCHLMKIAVHTSWPIEICFAQRSWNHIFQIAFAFYLDHSPKHLSILRQFRLSWNSPGQSLPPLLGEGASQSLIRTWLPLFTVHGMAVHWVHDIQLLQEPSTGQGSIECIGDEKWMLSENSYTSNVSRTRCFSKILCFHSLGFIGDLNCSYAQYAVWPKLNPLHCKSFTLKTKINYQLTCTTHNVFWQNFFITVYKVNEVDRNRS